jgi:hypothetical protein
VENKIKTRRSIYQNVKADKSNKYAASRANAGTNKSPGLALLSGLFGLFLSLLFFSLSTCDGEVLLGSGKTHDIHLACGVSYETFFFWYGVFLFLIFPHNHTQYSVRQTQTQTLIHTILGYSFS